MPESAAAVPEGAARVASRGSARGLLPYAVVACSVVFFWSVSSRALIYTLMPTIAAELGLSASLAGLAISTMALGYCAGSLVAGWLPGTEKARILAGLLLSLPGVLLVCAAGNLPVLLVGALAVGVGLGIYIPLGLAILVAVGGGGRTAVYMGVHEVMATLGSFSGSSFVAVGLPWTDWRGALLVWSTLGVVALLAFARVRAGSCGGRAPGLGEPVPLDRALLFSVYSYGAITILLVGLISMLPLIMVRAWGVGQTEAASVVGYTRLAGLVGVALAGLAAARLGSRRTTLTLSWLALAGAAATAADGYGPIFLAGVLVLAVGASGAITLLPIVIAEAFTPGQRSRALAMAGGLGGFLGMVLCPALFGVLLDAGLPTGPMVLSTVATLWRSLPSRASHAWGRGDEQDQRMKGSVPEVPGPLCVLRGWFAYQSSMPLSRAFRHQST